MCVHIRVRSPGAPADGSQERPKASVGQKLALTVLYVPYSLDSGHLRRLYRGTPLVRNSLFLGPYSEAMPSYGGPGGGVFLMSEVPL